MTARKTLETLVALRQRNAELERDKVLLLKTLKLIETVFDLVRVHAEAGRTEAILELLGREAFPTPPAVDASDVLAPHETQH